MQTEPQRLEPTPRDLDTNQAKPEPTPQSSPRPTQALAALAGDHVGQRKRPRPLGIALVSMLALVVLAGGIGAFAVLGRTPLPSSPASPTSVAFQTSSCLFLLGAGLTQGQNVRCGLLTVLEDHSRPHGPTIKLAVAVFKSPAAHPAPDPVVYLSGGPGGGVAEALGSSLTLASLAAWPGNRNLILFDQRGTGDSQPSLACTELTGTPSNAIVEAMRACRERLVQAGIHLNAYTTEQNAADVHDLIRALGYQQINLYGGSYGTRLALSVMRLFPQDLRSVVLDSAFPPQANLFTDLAPSAQRGFDTLFAGCAASSRCNSMYPNLQAVFAQVVTDLDQHPVPMVLTDPWTGKRGPDRLTGAALVAELRGALYQTALIPQLPALIYQLRQHEYTLAAQINAQVSFGGIRWGMFFSVECGEDMAFTTLPALETSVQAVEPESQAFFRTYVEQAYQVCQFWGIPPVPAVQKQAVTSAVPTLILAGEYDPTTPPANGRQTAQTLARGYFLLFPGVGHGIQNTSQCASGIIQTFQEHPQSAPDASCISTLGEPAFV